MRIPLILLAGLAMATAHVRAEEPGAQVAPVTPVIEAAPPTDAPPADGVMGAPAPELPQDEPSRWGFSLGGGEALEWRRDVNPEFGGFHVPPMIFGNVRFARWSLQLEWSFDGDRQSNAGAFRVQTSTNSLGTWARFALDDWRGYTPFVSVGGGAHFDRVRTDFQDKFDDRAGSRRFVGLGGGLNKTYWSHLLTEIEGRVTSEEATRGPIFSLVLRLGVTF